MKKGRKYVISTLTQHFLQFQRFLFFFNFAKGTTVSRVRFTPFPSSRSSLEGARSRGARCSLKKKRKKKKGEKKGKKKKISFLYSFCDVFYSLICWAKLLPAVFSYFCLSHPSGSLKSMLHTVDLCLWSLLCLVASRCITTPCGG